MIINYIKIIMFTTLLLLLYPPLKGFSHSLDTYVCKPLPAALQGVRYMKRVVIKNYGALEAFLSCF